MYLDAVCYGPVSKNMAVKVSALHFCQMDFFKSDIFRISMKNMKNWCIAYLCGRETRLTALKMGGVVTIGIVNFICAF